MKTAGARAQRAPIVNRTSLRRVSSNSSKLRADSHSSHSTSSTGRTAFLGHFHAAVFNVHDVHLQRFDQKIPVVAAIRTGQRHASLPSGRTAQRFYVMVPARRNANMAEIDRFRADGERIVPNPQRRARSALDCLGQPRRIGQAPPVGDSRRRDPRTSRNARAPVGGTVRLKFTAGLDSSRGTLDPRRIRSAHAEAPGWRHDVAYFDRRARPARRRRADDDTATTPLPRTSPPSAPRRPRPISSSSGPFEMRPFPCSPRSRESPRDATRCCSNPCAACAYRRAPRRGDTRCRPPAATTDNASLAKTADAAATSESSACRRAAGCRGHSGSAMNSSIARVECPMV